MTSIDPANLAIAEHAEPIAIAAGLAPAPTLALALPLVPHLRPAIRPPPFPRPAARDRWPGSRSAARSADRGDESPFVVGPADRPGPHRGDARLANPLRPDRRAGLAQYPFLERLGFFGIEVGTTRGSLAFLRQSLADPRSPRGHALDHGPGRVRRSARPACPAQGGNRPPGQPPVAAARSFRWPSNIPSGTTAARKPWHASAARSRSRRSGEYSPSDWTARDRAGPGGDPGRAGRAGPTPRPLGVHDADRGHGGSGRRLRSLAAASRPRIRGEVVPSRASRSTEQNPT